MGFYEEFNKYYDLIFPMGKQQLEFISKRIEGKEVLDVACGTGNYAIALSKLGLNLSGIDLDEGMITALKEKALAAGQDVKALTGDMGNLQKYFDKESFHAVYMIGNSLVHLTKLDEIRKVIEEIFYLLKADGILILQIINYDRILKYNVDGLPTIENKEAGVSLVRNYQYMDGLIHFNTTLIVAGDKKYINSVPLYPLKRKELMKIVEEVGFSIEERYGSFQEDPLNDESYGTIIVAKK